MEELVQNVGDGSKTTLNSILAEYGANYDILRESYIIEAKIAYLREDLFGVNGDKVGNNLIEEYYQQTYARFKQVFFYTYEYVYETDENGDNIYYTEDGKVSYDTSKTLKKDANGEQVYDENGDRVYVYVDENGKERVAYKLKGAKRQELFDDNGDPIVKNYEGDKLAKIVDKANSVLDQVKEGDTIGFDLLVTEHNEETGHEKYPNGYYITEETQYASPEVIEELFTLKVGEYKMVRSKHGIHIIMRYELEDSAYTLDEYEDLFIATSTGTYIFMGDLIDKLYADYVSSYKDKIIVDESLLEGVDIKSVGVNYNY